LKGNHGATEGRGGHVEEKERKNESGVEFRIIPPFHPIIISLSLSLSLFSVLSVFLRVSVVNP
jgi:hypothetical protein